MVVDTVTSTIVPFAGSGILGYAMGFALKKVLKWVLIIIGFIAGMFLVGVQPLHKWGYVGVVNWDKLGNDTSAQIQHFVGNAINITDTHGLLHTLGIPVTGGLALGFIAGFIHSR